MCGCGVPGRSQCCHVMYPAGHRVYCTHSVLCAHQVILCVLRWTIGHDVHCTYSVCSKVLVLSLVEYVPSEVEYLMCSAGWEAHTHILYGCW